MTNTKQQEEKYDDHLRLTSARVFDVKCPPAVNSNSAQNYTPGFGDSYATVPRRISVEMNEIVGKNQHGCFGDIPIISKLYKDGNKLSDKFVQKKGSLKDTLTLINIISSTSRKGKAENISDQNGSNIGLKDHEVCIVRLYDPMSYRRSTGVAGIDRIYGKMKNMINPKHEKDEGRSDQDHQHERNEEDKDASVKTNSSKKKRKLNFLKKSWSKSKNRRNEATVTFGDEVDIPAIFGAEDEIDVDEGQKRNQEFEEKGELWVERYALPLSAVIIQDVRESICVVSFCPGEAKWIYELSFISKLDGESRN